MIIAQSTIPVLNRFLSNAVSNDLTAIVVPGMEIARAYQLDLRNSGLILTDVPHHANVLALIGEIPQTLRQHALTLYHQMPAPKAILSIGTTQFDPLPVPDAKADFNWQSITQAIGKLQELFSKKAFERNGNYFSNYKQQTQQGHDMKNMEGMEHGSDEMGFMSMVMMTENLPKSPDGLPMEWGEVHFGPLFAGLPGGLELTFLLDGDSVADTQASTESVKRNLESKWLGSVSNFLDIFSSIDPLAPQSYRILAELALEDALKKPADEKTKSFRVFQLEQERVASHLNWLALYATLLHFRNLSDKAERFLSHLYSVKCSNDYNLLHREIQKLKSNIENNWFLKKRLSGIGIIGVEDAWTRLLTIFSEVDQSLSLLHEQRQEVQKRIDLPDSFSGSGKASIKTPRGKAELSIKLQNGKISTVSFISASTKKIALIPELVQNSEVGDALIAVASLNLSPWEVAL